MSRYWILWVTICFSIFLGNNRATAQEISQNRSICPANLGTAIDSIVNRPEFGRSRWGILITALSSSQPLYSRDAQKYFIPASNVKLLTTAAVLTELGANFRIRTSVYGDADHLRIFGRGDPSFTTAQLQTVAQKLVSQGIHQINQLIADDSYFQDPATNPTWEWQDIQAGYGAPVNSLILNRNEMGFSLVPQALGQPLQVHWDNPSEGKDWEIENNSQTVTKTESEFVEVGRDFSRNLLRVGGQLQVGSASETASVAVINPTQNFLDQFKNILQHNGIKVNQIRVIHQQPIQDRHPELAVIESPPLSELITETNRESNNLYAEALLRILNQGKPNATEALKPILTRLGVNPDGYHLADAAGLSRQNYVTPEALVQTLRGIMRSPAATVYRSSLAVAGQNGTLQNRFLNTPVQGKLQGKTGFLTGVVALSGYLTVPGYDTLAFSILVNQTDSNFTTRQAIDEMILLLSRLRHC